MIRATGLFGYPVPLPKAAVSELLIHIQVHRPSYVSGPPVQVASAVVGLPPAHPHAVEIARLLVLPFRSPMATALLTVAEVLTATALLLRHELDPFLEAAQAVLAIPPVPRAMAAALAPNESLFGAVEIELEPLAKNISTPLLGVELEATPLLEMATALLEIRLPQALLLRPAVALDSLRALFTPATAMLLPPKPLLPTQCLITR